MPDEADVARQKLARLSGSARRLLDYVALLAGGSPGESEAYYAVIRHLARATEEDLVVDLAEVVDAGIIAAVEGKPNVYAFTDAAAREIVLAEIGEARIPKLRARAEGALRRVRGKR